MMNKNKSELFKIILPFIKGKDVLDVGCVEHTAKAKLINPFWVHQFLHNNCNVLGIDILKKDVKILRSKGYNIKVANAETFNLKKKFNVIFAGELIEHLSNPGLFLQQSKKHLTPHGYLILTTPNTFYLPRTYFEWDDPIVNEEHTNWFSPTILQTLLKREGFKVIDIKRFDASASKQTLKSKFKCILNSLLPVGAKIKGSLLVIAKVKQ